MMFGFVDSASEHAVALVHFHHYVCFFLVLIIIFVVWLLKLVLKFVVFEKHLLYVNNSVFFQFKKVNSFHYVYGLVKVFFFYFDSIFFDFVYLLLFFFNAAKLKVSYSINKTIYPDQGIYVDSFPVIPALVDDCAGFVGPYKGNLYKNHLSVRDVSIGSNLGLLRFALYIIPGVFPYERVRIPSYGVWRNVEAFVTYFLYVGGYYAFLKQANLVSYFSMPHQVMSQYVLLPFNSRLLSQSVLRPLKLTFSKLVGVSSEGLSKGYCWFLNPASVLLMFYNSDVRGFFFLFFQNVRHRKVLEWVWTCVPAFILLLLLYPSLSLLYCYDRPYITRPYLTFKAIGHQWYWSYEYSDYVANDSNFDHIKFDSYLQHEDDLGFGGFRLLEVDRRVVLPVGVCVRFITTSADVLHSWAVPALGVKIDAVPGRLNQFWIIVDRPGTFYGQCSELCGVNHGFMPIVIEGVGLELFFDYLNAVYA